MSKISKRTLLALVLTLVLALCAGSFAACSNNDSANDSEITYTVTVTTAEGDPAEGVKVTVKKGSATFETAVTDSEGKVTFKLAEDSYEVALSSLPAHYEVNANDSLALTKDHADLTVTLVQKFAYKVYLVDESDQPFYAEGVEVGVCTDSNCLPTVALDSNGLATIEAEKGNYHVQIVDLPAGYAYRCDDKGYYSGKEFTATETVMSITIYAVDTMDITGDTAMSAAEKAAVQAEHAAFDTAATAYKYTAQTAAHSVKYFSVTPALTGKYFFYRMGDAADYYDGTSFDAAGSGTYAGQYKILEAGKTYYFALGNATDSAMTTDFIIVVPYSSYTVYRGVGGTVEVTVGKANDYAVIEYTPTASGVYTATAQGDALAYVCESPYDPTIISPSAPADDDYVKGSTDSSNVSAKAVVQNKTTIYFAIAVKAATYPATVSVKLEKTDESPDKFSYAQVTETLTKYTKTEGTELYGVPMDGNTDIVYSEEDGYYHVGDENGAIVVVLLTEGLDKSRFEEGLALAYMDMDANFSRGVRYSFNKAETGEPVDEVDYTLFLRGFAEYEYDERNNPRIPEDIDTEVYYAKYVNEDGAYPLTKELKEFLELFVSDTVNSNTLFFQLPMDMGEGCDWMFPLYYYGAATVADPLCGEYKFVSHDWDEFGDEMSLKAGDEVEELNWNFETSEYDKVTRTVTDEEYRLVINKNNTFTIYDSDDYEEVEGTWAKDESGAYTFTEVSFMGNFDYSVTVTADTITITAEDDSATWVFKIPSEE